jgi:hypothetical protein
MRFVDETAEFFKNNFSHVGVTQENNNKFLNKSFFNYRICANNFEFFASGRINVNFLLI